jgi:hypothetical protein
MMAKPRPKHWLIREMLDHMDQPYLAQCDCLLDVDHNQDGAPMLPRPYGVIGSTRIPTRGTA